VYSADGTWLKASLEGNYQPYEVASCGMIGTDHKLSHDNSREWIMIRSDLGRKTEPLYAPVYDVWHEQHPTEKQLTAPDVPEHLRVLAGTVRAELDALHTAMPGTEGYVRMGEYMRRKVLSLVVVPAKLDKMLVANVCPFRGDSLNATDNS